MSICGHGCVIPSNYILWIEEENQITASLEKVLCEEDHKVLPALSMSDLERFLNYVAEKAKLSDVELKRQSDFVTEGFGWVKTVHILLRLCQLSQKHASFDQEVAKEHLKRCLSQLCAKGFDHNAPLVLQSTKPLHLAAGYGCTALCEALIAVGARLEEPNEGEYDKPTPLHKPANYGKVETIRALLKLGSNVNAPSKGCTPLIAGVYYPEVTELLCQNGADVNAKAPETCFGPTAFDKAIKAGATDTAQILLKAGAVVTAEQKAELRKSLTSSIAWNLFTCDPCYEEAASLHRWLGGAFRTARYIDSLRFLSHRPSETELQPLKVPDIKHEAVVSFEAAGRLQRLALSMKAIAQKAHSDPENTPWFVVSKLLHDQMEQYICELQS